MAITVTQETIDQAAGDTNMAREEVQGNDQRIQGIADVLAAAWAGQAAASFQNLMQRYRERLTRIMENMDSIEERLIASGASHSSTDEDQSSAMNQFDVLGS